MSVRRPDFPFDGAESGAVVDQVLEADHGREVKVDTTPVCSLPKIATSLSARSPRSSGRPTRCAEPIRVPVLERLPTATMHKPRPIWLLIGVLWLSTALVTVGAVFVISALVG